MNLTVSCGLLITVVLAVTSAGAQTTAPPAKCPQGDAPCPSEVRKITPPRVLYAPDPQYSPDATYARLEGTVILTVVVGENGRTRDIKIVRGLGVGLDENSVAAIREWRFQPALQDGKPVAFKINVEVNFHLGYKPPSPRDEPLGDVARRYRQNKQSSSVTVITNEDLATSSK